MRKFRQVKQRVVDDTEPARSRYELTSSERWKKINEKWFFEHGITDPVTAYDEWQKFKTLKSLYSEQDERRYYKKILELASGLKDAAIRFYLKGEVHHISLHSYRVMAHISRVLGYNPPVMPATREDVKAGLYSQRIALLSILEVSKIPSQPYHLEVIRSVIYHSAKHNYLCSLHEVSQEELELIVERILRVYYPDAVIMVRLTPSPKSIGILKDFHIPTILVHADICEYDSPPVLANIVPDQQPIKDYLTDKNCMRRLVGLSRQPHKKTVIVAMKKEKAKKGSSGTIRNERIDFFVEALKPFGPKVFEVDDYSFRQALEVLEKYPDAFYVCLSDQIAVGLKHLLKVTNKGDYERRVLGFDNSTLARLEHVPSFDQGLMTIGRDVCDVLHEFSKQRAGYPLRWPRFETRTVPLELKFNQISEGSKVRSRNKRKRPSQRVKDD